MTTTETIPDLTEGSAACLGCDWAVTSNGYAPLLGEAHTRETGHSVLARGGGGRRYGGPGTGPPASPL
ncbi:hypothetical protein J3A78_003834 [Streptomyces sp. PvR006]|uniref:hypothetical protein n=1 Tax=Streptomyces sp. PvR006 TaxID=2817860 RepID=UPI001AE8B6C7|nr:hypothetical protein [Streptomyces sp. PvR006]MBP2583356.1 hypothetical protein [Streptomyces sp. PvR006]